MGCCALSLSRIHATILKSLFLLNRVLMMRMWALKGLGLTMAGFILQY